MIEPRPPRAHLALVLHAHLPYVRHPEHPRSLEERWLHEALWETYLPLLDLFDRLEIEGIHAPISLSVSPPLAAMWADPLLRARSLAHLDRIRALAHHTLARDPASPFAPALRHHQALLARAAATFARHGGDVLAGFARHHQAGRLHLFTTTATHAFLPGLLPARGWVRAQIELGQRAFARLAGFTARGLWLPECAYAPALDAALGRAGAGLSVLDAHGLAHAEPRPDVATVTTSTGPLVVPTAPLSSAAGITYFGRDLWAGRSVWAMAGYPSDPVYRELHRDLGFDAEARDLLGETGPHGTRVATGLRLHRITGAGPDKQPYDPTAALARAAEHASRFVADRARLFAALPPGPSPALSVVPFDAELFGHFWHEGPVFLEQVLRRLASSEIANSLSAISLADYVERYPAVHHAQPATSTWGEGGFGATWTGPRTASLWRHVHHASARVRAAVLAAPGATGIHGEALDQAIVEALLLQSSDFAFMIHRRTTVTYAERRTAEHAAHATRLAGLAIAETIGSEDAAWIRSLRERTPFLSELTSPELRAPFLEADA